MEKNEVITVENIALEQILNSDAMYWGYACEELKENAGVIVKVKVLDDLTSGNSLC